MNTIEFQIYDYMETNETVDDEEDVGRYIIHTFGRTSEGKSVYCKVTNYLPYFYILLPDRLQKKSEFELNQICEKLYIYMISKDNKKVFSKFKQTLKKITIVKLKRSEGFTNDQS